MPVSSLRPWSLALFLLQLISCHTPVDTDQNEQFDLSASACTVIGNPIEVVAGICTDPGGGAIRVPSGYFLESDWTGSGTVEDGGDAFHAAPDSLHLLWYAYAEDRFYQGDFALPRQRIHALLKAGYWDDDYNKHDTYGDITICTLPGGGVVVWLSGGNKVVLGRYQGHAVAYDFASFKPGVDRTGMAQEERAKLPAAVQEQLRTNTFGPGPWDAYLVKYPWRVEATMQETPRPVPLTLYNHYVRYFSAEDDTYPVSKKDLSPYLDIVRQPTPKAVPKSLGLFVRNKYGEKHEIRVKAFDEAETMAAFQALAARHPKEPIVLRLEVDKLYTRYRLTLGNGFQTLPLDKAVVKIFEED